MSTNFGAAAQDYAQHRAGFPPELFERLDAFGIGEPGELHVDLGTGTGSFARGVARRGGHVIGVDPDARLLHEAQRLDADEGLEVEYVLGCAEHIPLPAGVAQTVSAGQCWHWFDPARAAREVARITQPGGRVVIAHFDWLPVPGNLVEATERLIVAHNPHWEWGGGDGIHTESVPHLRSAGFGDFATLSFELAVPYSAEAWRGRIRASAGVGASLAPEAVRAFDAELAELLARDFPGEGLSVPHRAFSLIGQRTTARPSLRS